MISSLLKNKFSILSFIFSLSYDRHLTSFKAISQQSAIQCFLFQFKILLFGILLTWEQYYTDWNTCASENASRRCRCCW